MIHQAACPAVGEDDDELYYLPDLDFRPDGWREYAALLLRVRAKYGCADARFVAENFRWSADALRKALAIPGANPRDEAFMHALGRGA